MNKKSRLLSLFVIVTLLIGMVGVFNVDTSYAASKKKVHLSNKTVSLVVGESYQQKLLNKKGKTIKAKKVKWKSSNGAIASINKKGKITANRAGTVKMTAKYKRKTYKFTVYVKNKPTPTVETTGISYVSSGDININIGESYRVEVNVYPSNATNKTVNWYFNSDPSVATLDENGVVVGKKTGSTYIAAATYNYAYATDIKRVVVSDPSTPPDPDGEESISRAEAEEKMHKYIIENGKEVPSTGTIIGDYYIESRSSATSSKNRVVVSAYIDKPTIIMYSIASDGTDYNLFHNQPDVPEGRDDFRFTTNEKDDSIYHFPLSFWGKIKVSDYSGKLYGEENGIYECEKNGPTEVTDATELYKTYRKTRDAMQEFDSFLDSKLGFGLNSLGYGSYK